MRNERTGMDAPSRCEISEAAAYGGGNSLLKRFRILPGLRFGFLQNLSLGCLLVICIQRIAAGDQAEARRGGAITEGAADVPAVERAPGQHVGRHLRIRQDHAPQADEIGHAGPDGILRRVRQPFLQVGVAAAGNRQAREARLERGGVMDQTGYAGQRILGRLVPVGGREEGGALDVRIVVRAARRQVDQFDLQ